MTAPAVLDARPHRTARAAADRSPHAAVAGQFPFLTLVPMRGEYADFQPSQVPMGLATEDVLKRMDLQVMRADAPSEVAEVASAALDTAFLPGGRVAVLLGQKSIGHKTVGA